MAWASRRSVRGLAAPRNCSGETPKPRSGEVQLPSALFAVTVPAAGFEGDLAQAGRLAREQELLLETREEELLELVEVGGAVDQDRQRAAREGFQGAVVVQRVGDQLRPAVADL